MNCLYNTKKDYLNDLNKMYEPTDSLKWIIQCFVLLWEFMNLVSTIKGKKNVLWSQFRLSCSVKFISHNFDLLPCISRSKKSELWNLNWQIWEE